jgi:hypothetical protein
MQSSNNKEQAVQALQTTMRLKEPNLTPVERAFLHALLIDESYDDEELHTKNMTSATKKLNDDILFSLPFPEENGVRPPDNLPPSHKRREPSQRNPILGLWSAFEAGVGPAALARHASKGRDGKESTTTSTLKPQQQVIEQQEPPADENDDCSARSDEEVRHEHDGESEGSSWGDEEGAPGHYDAWEVLKDEYAKDFGFDYSPILGNPEDENHVFKILGTSAADKEAQPHVLSPPLMDSLMTFLPESLANQNFWLKYSLVRDGASLDTLRRYTRACPKTILAVETMDGQVFGSFTCENWHNDSRFFGEESKTETFLWRMRHGRNSKCASLFYQAQMETEIDVYYYSGVNNMIQLCNDDALAVGAGELVTSQVDAGSDSSSLEERSERFSFGLYLDDVLMTGTTGPCATFRNPCLMDGGAHEKRFDILNIEVWTLTPCRTVDAAEKLEMKQFFIHESFRSTRSARSSTSSPKDFLSQENFYRRVGENEGDAAQEREAWQYAQMMDTANRASAFF